MLISVQEINKKFAVKPKVVLHVGAHKAEESESMRASGWGGGEDYLGRKPSNSCTSVRGEI
jgi:hypothetical protein